MAEDFSPTRLKALEDINYLHGTWAIEDHCEEATDKLLAQFGKKAPKTLPAMGVLLGYLDGVSSCMFGCSGGDHLIEQQVFRVCNRARGAIRLLRMGFYDESLMLTRANAETANMLTLFMHDHGSYPAWKAQEKWTTSPVQIRLKLEALNVMLPADQERYKLLSGMAAHSGPDYAPAAHNVASRPISPGHLQEAGTLLAMNEAALQIIFVSVAARGLLKMPQLVSEAIRDCSMSLLNTIGSITIESYGEHWERERGKLASQLYAEPDEVETSTGADPKS